MRRLSVVLSLLIGIGIIFCSVSTAQDAYRLDRSSAAQSQGSNAGVSTFTDGQYSEGQNSAQQYSQPLYDQVQRNSNTGSSSNAQGTANAQGSSRAKPLTGGVERRASLVDPSEFQTPLYGRSDNNQLQGNTQAMQMRSGVASAAPFASGIMNNGPFFGGLNQLGNPLQGLIPNFGNLPPLSTEISRNKMPGDISDIELKQLQNRDIVIHARSVEFYGRT